MPLLLIKSSQGNQVKEVQTLLVARGFLTDEEITGTFDNETIIAVRAFQAQNLDQHGQPLTVDGKVGELTWWSLHNPKPKIDLPSAIDFTKMPTAGGTHKGRAALAAAIGELKANAREIGGENRGPFVEKYLNGLVAQGNPWCAGFVSWCFAQTPNGIPFPYSVRARNILDTFRKKNWAQRPGEGFEPAPGDIVVWWRESLSSGKGHIGLVHQVKDGYLYTIEGNRSSRVQGFSYVLSRMDKLLGFGRVPDA